MTNILEVEFFGRPEGGAPEDAIQFTADSNALGKWCWSRLYRYAIGRVEVRRTRADRPVPTLLQEFDWRCNPDLNRAERDLVALGLMTLAREHRVFNNQDASQACLALANRFLYPLRTVDSTH